MKQYQQRCDGVEEYLQQYGESTVKEIAAFIGINRRTCSVWLANQPTERVGWQKTGRGRYDIKNRTAARKDNITAVNEGGLEVCHAPGRLLQSNMDIANTDEVLPDERIKQILDHLAQNDGVGTVLSIASAIGVEDYEAYKMVKHGSSFALWCFGSDQKIRDTSVLIGYVTPLYILLERDPEDSKQLLKVLAELDQGTEGLIDWMLEWCRNHPATAKQLVLDILKRDWPSGIPSLPSHLAYHVPFQQGNKDDVLELVQAIEDAFTGPLKTYEDAEFHLADARELRDKWSKIEPTKIIDAEPTLPIDDRFVAFWNEAGSLADVVSEFSITPREASKKANYLRSKGIELKKFKRVANATDAEFLRVWNESESVLEVADKLSLKPSYVHKKVMVLRRNGEQLEPFTRGANIAQDAFTVVWNDADNAKAVAAHFRVSIPTVNRLRTQFRKQGSQLKRMCRSLHAA